MATRYGGTAGGRSPWVSLVQSSKPWGRAGILFLPCGGVVRRLRKEDEGICEPVRGRWPSIACEGTLCHEVGLVEERYFFVFSINGLVRNLIPE